MSEQFNPYSPVKPNTDEKFIFPSVYLKPPTKEGQPVDKHSYINLTQNEEDIRKLELNAVLNTSPIFTQEDLNKEVARQIATIKAQLEAQFNFDVQNQVATALKPERLINEAKTAAKNKLFGFVANAKNFLQNDATRTKKDIANVWGGLLGGAKKLLNVTVDTGSKVANSGVNTVFDVGSVVASGGQTAYEQTKQTANKVGNYATTKAAESYEQAKQAAVPLSEKVREISFNLANNSYEVIGEGERAIERYSRLEEQLASDAEAYNDEIKRYKEIEQDIISVPKQGLNIDDHLVQIDLYRSTLQDIKNSISSIQKSAASAMLKLDVLDMNQVIQNITNLHDKIETQNPGYLYAEGLSSKLSLLEQKCYAILKKYLAYPNLPAGLNKETNPYYIHQPVKSPETSVSQPNTSQKSEQNDSISNRPQSVVFKPAPLPQNPFSSDKITQIAQLSPEELLHKLNSNDTLSVVVALEQHGQNMQEDQLEVITKFIINTNVATNKSVQNLAIALLKINNQETSTRFKLMYESIKNIKFWEKMLSNEQVFAQVPVTVLLQIVVQVKQIIHDSNNVTVIDLLLELLRNTDRLTSEEKSGLYNQQQNSESADQTESGIANIDLDDLINHKPGVPIQSEATFQPLNIEKILDTKTDFFLTNPENFINSLGPTSHDIVPQLLREHYDKFTTTMLVKLLKYTLEGSKPEIFKQQVLTEVIATGFDLSVVEDEQFDKQLTEFVNTLNTENNVDLIELSEKITEYLDAQRKSKFVINDFNFDESPYEAIIEPTPIQQEEETEVLSVELLPTPEEIKQTAGSEFSNTKVETTNQPIAFNNSAGEFLAQPGVKYTPQLALFDTLYISYNNNEDIGVIRKTPNGLEFNNNFQMFNNSGLPSGNRYQTYLLQPAGFPKTYVFVINGLIQEISTEYTSTPTNVTFEISNVT